MAFKFQENLDSQVNGTETVFTLPDNISLITAVTFDGVAYIGTVTVTGAKEITLADAPNVSLRVSYYTSAPTGTSNLILVSDAIARLQRAYNDNLGEISNELFFDWFSDLNYMIYRVLYKNDPTAYINTVPFSITDGTAAYSLPSDFKDMKVRGCGIFKDDATTGATTSKRLIQSGVGSKDLGYYLNLNTFVVTPEPDTASTVTMRYIPKVLPITATTDYLYLDIEHFNAVINYLDKRYGQWNLDSIKEMSADARFTRDLQEILSDTYRTPKIVRFR